MARFSPHIGISETKKFLDEKTCGHKRQLDELLKRIFFQDANKCELLACQ